MDPIRAGHSARVPQLPAPVTGRVVFEAHGKCDV